MLSDRTKNEKLWELLNVGSFHASSENMDDQTERLREIYSKAGLGSAIDYASWRKKQADSASEMKDFRNASDYVLFSKQLYLIVGHIKDTFLKRQAVELAESEASLPDELFKPLLSLPDRLLNPDIVTHEKKQGQRSEAELSYTDGKHYLEGILYRVETAPFDRVASVLKTLLIKQQGQGRDSLSVCAEGTRQHLQSAYFDLSDDISIELDNALLSVLKQHAYEFINQMTINQTKWQFRGKCEKLFGSTYEGIIQIYEGVEIHLCATLVNFAYNKLGLVPHGTYKIDDSYAYPPRHDGTILVHLNDKPYRCAIKIHEAEQFVSQLSCPVIIKNVVDRLAFRFYADLQRVSSYGGAKEFIEKLMKLAGVAETTPEASVLHKKLFGYYRQVRLNYKNTGVLNEAQLQEINEYGVDDVLLTLKSRHGHGSALFMTELNELCELLALYPEIDRTTVSKNVLLDYEKLIEVLCCKTQIKELNSVSKTSDHDILKYVHSQLLQHLQQLIPKRDKMALAALKRLNQAAPLDSFFRSEQKDGYFGAGRVYINADDDDLSQLDDSKYCPLDQLRLHQESSAMVKTPEMIAKDLQDFILLFMIKGRHLKGIPFGWVFLQMDDLDAKHHLIHFYYQHQRKKERDHWIAVVNKSELLSTENKKQVIMSVYGSIEHALRFAILNNQYIEIDILIRVYGASPDSVMPESIGHETILHHALRMRQHANMHSLASMLIRENANFNIPDLSGLTALNIVSQHYVNYHDDESYSLLKQMLKNDHGCIFERFKDIYFENSCVRYIHFFGNTMGDYLRSGQINNMMAVLTYLERHPKLESSLSKHVFDTLIRELSVPRSVIGLGAKVH